MNVNEQTIVNDSKGLEFFDEKNDLPLPRCFREDMVPVLRHNKTGSLLCVGKIYENTYPYQNNATLKSLYNLTMLGRESWIASPFESGKRLFVTLKKKGKNKKPSFSFFLFRIIFMKAFLRVVLKDFIATASIAFNGSIFWVQNMWSALLVLR